MRVVIAGATPLGLATARKMIDAEHEVVVIDRNRQLLDEVSETLDCGMIEGDATHPSTLREAGNESPDVLFALTSSDEDNVLCALVGRSIGFERVVPQIIDPELSSVCDELGLEDMIMPHETVAASLRDMAENRREGDLASRLTGDFQLMHVRIKESLAGTQIDDLELGGQGRPVLLRRGDSESLADGATRLQEDDELIVIAHRDERETILDEIGQRST